MDIFGEEGTLFSLPQRLSRPWNFSHEKHGSKWGDHHLRNGTVTVYAMEAANLHVCGRTKCYQRG